MPYGTSRTIRYCTDMLLQPVKRNITETSLLTVDLRTSFDHGDPLSTIHIEQKNRRFIIYHRFSLTKKWSVRYEAAVSTVKKIPSSAVFGHQNDCECKPNVDRITAAGTSSSTPYLVSVR